MKILPHPPFRTLATLIAAMLVGLLSCAAEDSRLRMVVVGLEHGHANGFFRRVDTSAVEIVGISESDPAVVEKYFDRYELDTSLHYESLDKMLKAVKPDAAAVFTNTKAHLDVVRACAPMGVHVMVEKPLAIDSNDAREMAQLARKHNIHLLTNYETTWYATTQEILQMEQAETLGETRKIVIHDGHRGPAEINVPPEFWRWLSDPELNGGGAIMDFGCYGANIMTAMMNNQRPLSVTAVTQTIKPEIYKQVDDEATIILEYPSAQGIIQASWNWPISRKDVELYGRTGQLKSVDATKMFVQVSQRKRMEEVILHRPEAPMHDPYVYFAAVVRGEIDPKGDLSSLENGLITMEILDAARESARTGCTVELAK